MSRLGFLGAGCAAISLLFAAEVRAVQGQAPAASSIPHAPSQFEGVWTYNADESINIATGKPEQAPRSAVARRGSAPVPAGSRTARGDSDGGFGARTGPGRASDIGPSPAMLEAARGLMRDLLEVPESLTIRVTSDDITITDDLDRTRAYPTDGSRHHYQLGASQFNARVAWHDSQLRQEIDGDYGFKMNETYFLSPDGKRLFVMLRVPTSGRNAAPIGADRIYDRVPAAPTTSASASPAGAAP
jgi:hypothetical protein